MEKPGDADPSFPEDKSLRVMGLQYSVDALKPRCAHQIGVNAIKVRRNGARITAKSNKRETSLLAYEKTAMKSNAGSLFCLLGGSRSLC